MPRGKKTIDHVGVLGKTVLMRVDYNVPLRDGEIVDDRRIVLTLDSIHSVLHRGGRLLLASHLGRPKGIGPEPAFSLAPCAARLRELLGSVSVRLAPDCVGGAVEDMVLEMNGGDVVMLENLRFHQGEKNRDLEFAAELAGLAEIYCHESFGTAHRKDASMIAVPEAIGRRGGARVAGFLLEREINHLAEAFDEPRRPFVAILGGAKVSDKIASIENLLPRVDAVLIGGAMAYTILRGLDVNVGSSLVESNFAKQAAQLVKRAAQAGTRLLLPVDHVCAQQLDEQAAVKVFEHAIPDGWLGLDVGPRTLQQYMGEIAKAKTIYWNGPLGAFEYDPFAEGTRSLAQVIALATSRNQATSIIGGGDSAAAVVECGLTGQMTHVSTGGGASLHMLEGHRFSSVDLLDDD
jgi:phosphoglycerate kinase